MKTKSGTAKGNYYVHNVRFYTIKPRGIMALAYSKEIKCLAISREEGSIELWDMRFAPYLDRVITLTPDSEVEALAWAGDRLFSVDLAGKLIEWDLTLLQPRIEQSPTGNALWCLDVNSALTELAVGSEEGHINIMSIENNEINYKQLFNKQEGRVLCCKFDKPGKRLVTGSLGAVRIWNVAKGTTLHTMTLNNKTTVVHSLLVLSNNTIIAGDSDGYVTVWNGANATQVESNKVMEENVFTLSINETEDRLVCSGRKPPDVLVFSKTLIKREESVSERWIKCLKYDVHKHYVKQLLVVGDNIISGGEDGLLVIASITDKTIPFDQYAPFLPGTIATGSPSAHLLLLRYPHSLHLWSLGQTRSNAPNHKTVGKIQTLQMFDTPDKLLELNVSNNKMIQAAALSPDGQWICYSTQYELRLSRVQLEPLALERFTEELPAELEVATHIFFSPTSKEMFLIHAESRQLRCFKLEDNQVDFLYSVNLSAHVKSPIRLVEMSHCGTYFVVATSDRLVGVWKMNGKDSKHLLNLPRYKAGTSALALQQDQPRLVVAYADARIVDYDLSARRFVCETTNSFVHDSQTHCIKGLLLDPQKPKIVMAYNESNFFVLKAGERQSISQQAKRSNSTVGTTNLLDYGLVSMFSRKLLIFASHFGNKELLTVSIQRKNLLSLLPPPYVAKKFGKA
ncbi:uncharacterized protein LOC117567808 [Drosophila albomicans]|uniref:Uncharacterized protein LOC117567808 n=1 Tax=Drosophila albomicans TaxID=7291 RepID=A0A6P8WWX3_DROAB|nr:uncharacterized protein LOC117567808 [Drosophila albomicans]